MVADICLGGAWVTSRSGTLPSVRPSVRACPCRPLNLLPPAHLQLHPQTLVHVLHREVDGVKLLRHGQRPLESHRDQTGPSGESLASAPCPGGSPHQTYLTVTFPCTHRALLHQRL